MVEGDPTEAALVVAARKAELHLDGEQATRPRLDAVPFESEHQYMATLHDGEGARSLVYLKGSVERVLERCDVELASDGERVPLAEDVRSAVDELAVGRPAGAGLRPPDRGPQHRGHRLTPMWTANWSFSACRG